MEHSRRWTRKRSAVSRAGLAALALCASGILATPLAAMPIQAGGGYDYYSGPNDQITRSVIALSSLNLGGTHATIAGLRFDDNRIGEGTGLIGGLGFPIVPTATLQMWGYRYIGDESFRAWRVKAGPLVSLPRGASLGLYYAHFADNAGTKSNGAFGELGVPIVAGLAGRVSAAFADVPGDLTSTQGSLGLTWAPFRNLELSAESGLAHNGAITTAPLPSGGPLGLPLIGGGSTTTEEKTTEPTYSVGVRVTFP